MPPNTNGRGAGCSLAGRGNDMSLFLMWLLGLVCGTSVVLAMLKAAEGVQPYIKELVVCLLSIAAAVTLFFDI